MLDLHLFVRSLKVIAIPFFHCKLEGLWSFLFVVTTSPERESFFQTSLKGRRNSDERALNIEIAKIITTDFDFNGSRRKTTERKNFVPKNKERGGCGGVDISLQLSLPPFPTVTSISKSNMAG